jgi:YesN/AraC family two-component response regulator
MVMNILENQLLYGDFEAPFSIEYARRTDRFTMPAEHFHAQYEIYYLISGERYYFIRDRTFHIRSGDLVLINTQELHKTSAAERPEHERVVIYFFESFLHQTYSEHMDLLLGPFRQESPVLRFRSKEMPYVESLISMMVKEMQVKQAGSEIRMKHIAIDLLLLAARHPNKKEMTPLPLDSPLHQKISDIARFIGSHISDDLTLSSLAKIFYISPYYLSRTFKEVTGFTLTEYVHTVRIRQAQKLLKESNLSITEISSSVGFDNFSHFGKIFKKFTSRSPREYRFSIS